MKFYWIKTHKIVKKIFSKLIWNIPNDEKKVYLTFDDGPTPEITNWVLNQLKLYNAKASFFCIGKNIENHPEILENIIKDGHSVGNHTFNHLNGWRYSTEKYVENILKRADSSWQNAKTKIKQSSIYKTQPVIHNPQHKKGNMQPATCNLFRPPYGKITPFQASKLRKLGYKIIMWDVLSADFDQKISPEKCLQNVISNVESGSIIVFHDSKKAFKNLEYALPKTLQFLKEKGFVCEKIVG